MTTQFSEMSMPDLIKAKDEIESLITEKQEVERQTLLERFTDQAKKSGFSFEEILCKPKKPVKQKYMNPNDLTQTWTGRGRKPAWFIESLASGKAEEDLLIK